MPAAVRLLAASRTADDIADLNAAAGALAVLVNEGTEGADLSEWSTAAFRFHDLIMERSGNTTLGLIGAVLREVVARHMSRAVTASTNLVEIESQFKKTIRAFTKLTGLIDAGDVEEAEEYWRGHMDRAAKGMLWGNLGAETVIDLFV